MVLPGEFLRRRIAQGVNAVTTDSRLRVDYSQPPGDPGLYGPDCVCWRVHADFTSMLVGGVAALELQALAWPKKMTGIVLRYGRLYGPGTGADTPDEVLAVHVDAAARAAVLAVTHGNHGIYNVAEPSAAVTSAKAISELGWNPDFRF